MAARLKLNFTRDGNILGAMSSLGKAVRESGLEASLTALVDVRASQINGCAFCLDMHTKDARAAGETEQRLHLLAAWREAHSIYTERERAALAWTEAVTRLEHQTVPNDAYQTARKQFGEQELLALTLAVVAINGWNRINIAFQTPAGHYRPGSLSALTQEIPHA
jgi:AhpD family alkylhydroperoxidase